MNHFTRREFHRTATASAAWLSSAAQSVRSRPNILMICSDQHDGRAMGCSGHPVVRTPNLDRLAARGVLFKNTYCGSPVCCPSRASLMTGMFPHDVGVYNNATCFDGQ